MEPQVIHTPFDEVLSQDINLLGRNSALAGDRALAAILHLPPNTGSVNYRGVIPHPMVGATQFVTPIVGGIRIAPFDVILQSRTQATDDAVESVKDIRVATCADSSNGYTDLASSSFPSANGTARHVLVYARITVDQNENQAIIQHRDPSTGNITSGPQVTRRNTTVSIQTVFPSNAGRPTLPADNGNSFTIPICIVCLPATWTAGNIPAANQIWELAPMVPLDGGVGATNVRPANSQWGDSGHLYPQGSGAAVAAAVDLRTPWNASASTPRPPAYLPPTMTGAEERLIAIDLQSSTPSHQNGDLLDDSVDWRKRVFWVMAQRSDGSSPFAWESSMGAILPSTGIAAANLTIQMGQSFATDTRGISNPDRQICLLNSSSSDGTTGINICCDNSGRLVLMVRGTPSARWFIWVHASAQFSNA